MHSATSRIVAHAATVVLLIAAMTVVGQLTGGQRAGKVARHLFGRARILDEVG
jgi:hypothetical protein